MPDRDTLVVGSQISLVAVVEIMAWVCLILLLSAVSNLMEEGTDTSSQNARNTNRREKNRTRTRNNFGFKLLIQIHSYLQRLAHGVNRVGDAYNVPGFYQLAHLEIQVGHGFQA